MGLDMYLIRYRKDCGERPTLKCGATREEMNNFDILFDAWKERSDYNSDYAYWRKFNALHRYFCEKANREINCEPFELDTFTVEDVLDRLKRIEKDHTLAKELLSSCEGFFFGDVEYDEWYFKDVEDSVKVFEKVLEEMKDYRFDYDAWW